MPLMLLIGFKGINYGRKILHREDSDVLSSNEVGRGRRLMFGHSSGKERRDKVGEALSDRLAIA